MEMRQLTTVETIALSNRVKRKYYAADRGLLGDQQKERIVAIVVAELAVASAKVKGCL
jgi:hypothetical protein